MNQYLMESHVMIVHKDTRSINMKYIWGEAGPGGERLQRRQPRRAEGLEGRLHEALPGAVTTMLRRGFGVGGDGEPK